jgi:GAF domain-containing protein
MNSSGTLVQGIIVLLVILLGILFAVGLARWILRQIHPSETSLSQGKALRHLTLIAQKIAQGDFSIQEYPSGIGDLSELTRALKSIAEHLQPDQANLNQRESQDITILQHRYEQLQAVLEITSTVGLGAIGERDNPFLITDVTEWLNRIARLIQNRFGYSQVGIFTLDDTSEWAVLRASAGEAWRSGIAQDSLSQVSKNSKQDDTISEATETIIHLHSGNNDPIAIAVENGQPAIYSSNPESDEISSGIALPLKLDGKVIGVLVVRNQQASEQQQVEEQTTTRTHNLAEDRPVLNLLADHLAIAIRNVKLLQELQNRLAELETLVARGSQETWRRFAQTGLAGYQYELGEITPIIQGSLPVPPTTIEAQPNSSEQLSPVTITEDSPTIDGSPISIPITVRGQVLAHLDVWPEPNGWTEEKSSMLRMIGDRLGQAIASAQLFEEIQRRAERERAIAEITTRVRASTNIDGIMQTAIQELAEKLKTSTVAIQIRSGSGNGDQIHG